MRKERESGKEKEKEYGDREEPRNTLVTVRTGLGLKHPPSSSLASVVRMYHYLNRDRSPGDPV